MYKRQVLTVEAHTPTSHKDHGWEQFTDQVIEIINKKTTHVVFILWGSYARAKKKLITNPIHYVIEMCIRDIYRTDETVNEILDNSEKKILNIVKNRKSSEFICKNPDRYCRILPCQYGLSSFGSRSF